MLIHMAIHRKVRPEHEADLIASMHRFGEAQRACKGNLSAQALRDRRTGALIGLARWESAEAWQAGIEKARAVLQGLPFHEWEEADPEVFVLEEV